MKGQLAPFWLLLFGLAALSAGVFGLADGGVAVPSSFLFSGRLDRASQPAAYWLLTLVYLAGGTAFLALAWQQRREPGVAVESPPRRPSPRWARGLAWVGVAAGVALLGAAVSFHFALGPLVSLMFVILFGGGGLLFLMLGLGYLITGRVQ